VTAYGLVLVGGSLGGFRALRELLGGLPPNFTLPLAVALHRAGDGRPELARLLQRSSARPVVEAEDKEPIGPGRVYLAPVGYHLLIEQGSFALSTDAPVRLARPSIDVLFESAAESYGATVIGIALTGSSDDGAAGLAAIAQRGGLAIVQDPREAESPVLPCAALARVPAARVLTLSEMGPFLAGLCQPLTGSQRAD
jgi:two-component system chemotaxis response regulator CheB